MCDRISLERLALLQELGRIARVVTHRKGYVNRAVLARLPGEANPTMLGDYQGTRYSFRERLPSGHLAYRMRSLGDNPFGSDAHLAPDDVRPTFLRVVLDCQQPTSAAAALAGRGCGPGRDMVPAKAVTDCLAG